MLFITQSVPKSLRGELTKWMLELKPGVFLGTLSTLVGEKLWIKIQEKQSKGGAIWVKATNNEQRFKMAISGNTHWKLSDFDGLQLITHPIRKYTNRKKESRKRNKIKKRSVKSTRIKEPEHPKITWDTGSTPINFITRKAVFKYKNSQFSAKYTGTSAYEEYPPESLWKKPWTNDLEILTKALLININKNFDTYNSMLKEKKIACLDIETTDFLPKAYEGFVNILGISIVDLKNVTSTNSSVLLFQAFNMMRKKIDAPKLLKLAYPYLEDSELLIVFNRNFDIKILSSIIQKYSLHLTFPKKIVDLMELFPSLKALEQYLTDQTGIKRVNSEKGKYSEYYKLFKGKGKKGINKKIEPIGVYNLTDALTPLFVYFLLQKE